MGLKSWLSKLGGTREYVWSDSDDTPELKFDDCAWTIPPADTKSPEVWDAFWMKHYEKQVTPLLFELFTNDIALVRTMRENGLRTILCVGNGIGQEPRALAEAGFDVTVLDISEAANALVRVWQLNDDYIERIIGRNARAPGGELRFVTGNLMDRSLCPGPYDVIIERLTLQLFLEDNVDDGVDDAMAAVAGRLKTPGILFSHCHNGRWRPGQPREHLLKQVFERNDWNIIENVPEAPLESQAAWLFFSTG